MSSSLLGNKNCFLAMKISTQTTQKARYAHLKIHVFNIWEDWIYNILVRLSGVKCIIVSHLTQRLFLHNQTLFPHITFVWKHTHLLQQMSSVSGRTNLQSHKGILVRTENVPISKSVPIAWLPEKLTFCW